MRPKARKFLKRALGATVLAIVVFLGPWEYYSHEARVQSLNVVDHDSFLAMEFRGKFVEAIVASSHTLYFVWKSDGGAESAVLAFKLWKCEEIAEELRGIICGAQKGLYDQGTMYNTYKSGTPMVKKAGQPYFALGRKLIYVGRPQSKTPEE